MAQIMKNFASAFVFAQKVLGKDGPITINTNITANSNWKPDSPGYDDRLMEEAILTIGKAGSAITIDDVVTSFLTIESSWFNEDCEFWFEGVQKCEELDEYDYCIVWGS
jgi:hypothetical protein